MPTIPTGKQGSGVEGGPRLAQHGATKIERSDKLMRAANLDAEASATIAQANSELRDARAGAVQAKTRPFGGARITLRLKASPTGCRIEMSEVPVGGP